MKKLRRGLAAVSIILALTFSSGSFVQVRAEGGPQGQQDSKSGGPSAPTSTLLLWLLGWF